MTTVDSSTRPGVVGLAIAQHICQRHPNKSTYLVERHQRAGQETSSRNSEVVHSGLYYPPESLKTRLCLRGRDLLYQYCKENDIPHQMTGKLIVGKSYQRSYLENLHAKSLRLTWPKHTPLISQNEKVLPTKLLSRDEIKDLEPDLSEDIDMALWSPKTGIVDSHAFMESLEKDIIDSEGGELVYSTRVVRVDPYQRPNTSERTPSTEIAIDGWVVQVITGDTDEGDAMLAKVLINASGLSSTLVLNSILPSHRHIPIFFARGSYASYNGPGISYVKHLIYPCPETGANAHAFQSLGTHLTLDLNGKIRFGPDIEWISPPSKPKDVSAEEEADFWTKKLIPDGSRLQQMHEMVTGYLPGVTLGGMQPDYVGIRPKLVPPQGGFQDFVIRTDYPTRGPNEGNKHGPMISLLGIESPGLTSSLAIAELVVDSVLERYQL
ncbi:FAD dependent oxidoreductase [Cyathus striatus]|nr:FAD dependent oxidoreductase [Cyathus striatus]